MKIAIVGTGYVGLVTGACLADIGHDVLCVDIDEERIRNLRKGIMPFYEPGLREVVEINQQQRRLMFTTDLQLAVEHMEIVFLAVGTPSDEQGRADLKYVFQAVDDIAKAMNGYKVIVTKSTVPVGTADKIKERMAKIVGDKHAFDVASNPEFLREGDAVQDFMMPDRIVIGAETERATNMLKDVYKALERPDRPIITTDVKTSELIKYASNAMLASRISFMNQIACLCDKVGGDVKTIAKAIGLDHRIGPRFLQAGVGYGGSCFPKDVKALIETLKEHDCDSNLIQAVDDVNQKQRSIIYEKIKSLLPDPKGKKVAIWGLAFKPKTDDMREAPAVDLINWLQKDGASIVAFDPIAEETARNMLSDVAYAETPLSALEGADLLVVVTEWHLFRELDREKMKELMNAPNIVDARNMFFPDDFKKLGFNYIGVGR